MLHPNPTPSYTGNYGYVYSGWAPSSWIWDQRCVYGKVVELGGLLENSVVFSTDSYAETQLTSLQHFQSSQGLYLFRE